MDAIETERLVLQPIDTMTAAAIISGDLGDLVAGNGWPQSDTIDGLRMEAQLGSSPACWLIQLHGTVIGELGWKGGPGPDGRAEIGYSLAPDYRGAGYATEAVQGFALWATTRQEVRRLVAETLVDNLASRRVLEKSGFTIWSAKDGYVYWLRETLS
ncbi:MAG: GNAT family N-acetyltransferase [Actinomycetota bacterium]